MRNGLAIFSALICLAAVGPAQAVPILRLTSSAGGDVTIVDGGVGDANAAAGVSHHTLAGLDLIKKTICILNIWTDIHFASDKQIN